MFIVKKSMVATAVALSYILSASGVASAQDVKSNEPSTDIERFTAESGEVIVQGFEDIGRLQCKYRYRGTLGIARFDNAVDGSSQSGLRIEVKGSGQYDSTKRSFVDYAEIESLLSGISYLETITRESSPLENVEATYSTNGGVKVTRFNDNEGKLNEAVQVGKYSSETCYLEDGGLTAFKATILKAQNKLNTL